MRRGYYPRGGGRISLTITPPASLELTPIDMTVQGSLVSLHAVVFGNVPLSTRQLTATKLISVPTSFLDTNTTSNTARKERVVTLGAQICAVTSTGCRLSANTTISVKTVSDAAVGEMVERVVSELSMTCLSGACVDEHTADQLIVYMSQCPGVSRLLAPSHVTSQHLVTAMKIVEDISGVRFTVTNNATVNTTEEVQQGGVSSESIVEGSKTQLIVCHGKK
eukprot:gene32052-39589_t